MEIQLETKKVDAEKTLISINNKFQELNKAIIKIWESNPKKAQQLDVEDILTALQKKSLYQGIDCLIDLLNQSITCKYCSGTGIDIDSYKSVILCDNCHGKGVV
jgi:DnaJ-class molecular chaperone